MDGKIDSGMTTSATKISKKTGIFVCLFKVEGAESLVD